MCRDFIGSIVNGDKIDGLFCISCSGKSWERCSINTILYELNSLFNIIVVFLFFFVKQKQAYERRISDWSSDVCSSDLCQAGRGARSGYADNADGKAQVFGHAPDDGELLEVFFAETGHVRLHQIEELGHHRADATEMAGAVGAAEAVTELLERKSVVWGRRVSVSVELGGRRLIKK